MRRAALVLATSMAAACASSPPNRWLKTPGPGPIVVDVPARPGEDAAAKAARARAVAEAVAGATPPARAKVADAESTHRRLRDALAALKSGESAAARLLVAREYHRLQVFDAAITHFDASLALEPRNAEAYDGRARVWRDSGLLGRALSDANRAVYYAPRSPAARNTLGTILEALGQFVEARRAYERALQLEPTAAYADANLRALAAREARRGPGPTP